jgi:hypothetical protein
MVSRGRGRRVEEEAERGRFSGMEAVPFFEPPHGQLSLE